MTVGGLSVHQCIFPPRFRLSLASLSLLQLRCGYPDKLPAILPVLLNHMDQLRLRYLHLFPLFAGGPSARQFTVGLVEIGIQLVNEALSAALILARLLMCSRGGEGCRILGGSDHG